jgi:hypothetical protein
MEANSQLLRKGKPLFVGERLARQDSEIQVARGTGGTTCL